MSASGREALWEQGQDEIVEVNQRALIDKVLARYSGEFTVFRELLQNADDAQATAAEIRFNTGPYLVRRGQTTAESSTDTINTINSITPPKIFDLPDLNTVQLSQWTFRNNGMLFRDQDWDRLKKIAEGNPDEQKIGAFGFYSLFSVTEEPFVQSGTTWMGFHWRNGGDQLFARRGSLPLGTDATPDNWTSFEMRLRHPAPLPGPPVNIARFLATSLTFMSHLRTVSVYFDGRRIVKIEKDMGFPQKIAIPKGLDTTSPEGMMSTTGMSSTELYMKATVLRWVYDTSAQELDVLGSNSMEATSAPLAIWSSFSSFTTAMQTSTPQPPRPPPSKRSPLEAIVSSVRLLVYSAEVSVQVDEHMYTELERATKKRPPATSVFQLVYTTKDQSDVNRGGDNKTTIFQRLYADLNGMGNALIFIGHATVQTTGMGGHVAARFIPTVERESIDLVDPGVSKWNKELLYVGGLLTRVIYELELEDISRSWSDGLCDDATQADHNTPLQDRAIYVLRFFTSHPTTPSPVVSEQLRMAFFKSGAAAKKPFPIISNLGVRPAGDVRIYDAAFVGFLKNTPMVLPEMLQNASLMLSALREYGMCKDISFQDVVDEIKERVLDEQEFVALLKWRMELDVHLQPEEALNALFLKYATLYIKEEWKGVTLNRKVSLADIRTFLDYSPGSDLIPHDTPLPNNTIPFVISKNLDGNIMKRMFGWEELSVPEWIINLVNPETRQRTGMDITKDAALAERALGVLARAWADIGNCHDQIYTVLSDLACVPTRAGLKIPSDAYFPHAHVFSDLAIVTMPKENITEGSMKDMLITLGVRERVDLAVIFDRMVHTGDWTASNLIEYLVDIQRTFKLSSGEMSHLRGARIFTQEGTFQLGGDNDGADILVSPTRCQIGELYEPTDTFRNLRLPTLYWKDGRSWDENSEEAKFLFALGINRRPHIQTILGLASSDNTGVRTTALRYFIKNHTYYPTYQHQSFKGMNFVPALGPDGSLVLASPTKVYSNPECAVMGFNVVKPGLDEQDLKILEIAVNPSVEALLGKLLGSPPQDEATSRKYYEYLATRIFDFSTWERNKVSRSAFIPAFRPIVAVDGTLNQASGFLKPSDVFFDAPKIRQNPRSVLFPLINFGEKAEIFLRSVGVRDEPDIEAICSVMVEHPAAFKNAIGGYDEYLSELKHIGPDVERLPWEIRQKMRTAPMFVGARRSPTEITPGSNAQSRVVDDTKSRTVTEFKLLKAADILIIDDVTAISLCGHEVWGAPQEEEIEKLYGIFGSKHLGSLVRKTYSHSPAKPRALNKKKAEYMRALVIERLPLFFYEQTRMKVVIQTEWLADADNFQVVMVADLQLTRQLDHGRVFSSTQGISAATIRQGNNGPVTLWVDESLHTDYFEVASSLCSVLVEHHKIVDSLLLMTFLSTDLHILKQRGYNVDRILHLPQPTAAVTNRRYGSNQQFLEFPAGEEQSSPPKVIGSPVGDGADVNSLRNFEANIRAEVGARHSESRSLFHELEEITTASTDLPRHYHSGSSMGRSNSDLELTEPDPRYVGGYQIYISTDVMERGLLVSQKTDVIIRFTTLIIDPLLALYKFPRSNVHIFYDPNNQLLTFNYNNRLFLNLRFYELWHDQTVDNGSPRDALMYWYFILAYEIAIVVRHHPREHKYCFGSLAELHKLKLIELLSNI